MVAMKFNALLAFLPVLPVYSLRSTYDPIYDNASESVNVVACSNVLADRGFTTFGSLPSFPNIGGAPAIAGFGSPNCATCWELTYVNPQGVSKSINILAIDAANPNFNIAEEALNTLTGGKAVQLGSVPVTAKQVSNSACGL